MSHSALVIELSYLTILIIFADKHFTQPYSYRSRFKEDSALSAGFVPQCYVLLC
jgi:hypothetical protein